MAVLTGSKEATLQEIVKTILCGNLDNKANAAYQALENYNCHTALYRMVSNEIGYSEGDDFNLRELAKHIIISALSKTIREDDIASLNHYFAATNKAFCYDLIAEWMHSESVVEYYDVAQAIERELNLQNRNSSQGYRQNKDKFATSSVALGCNFTGNTINNSVFSLSFYQKEAVGGNKLATTYKLYFANITGKPICQPRYIIADKTSANEQERIFKVHFNLNNQSYDNKEKYYLLIEAADGTVYKKIEFTIDIALDF